MKNIRHKVGRQGIRDSDMQYRLDHLKGRKPLIIFFFILAGYLTIYSASVITDNQAVKLFSNASALIAFGICFFLWIVNRRRKIDIQFLIAFALFYFGMLGSLLLNFEEIQVGDFLKLLLAPFFFVFGIQFSERAAGYIWQIQSARWIYAYLIIIPLLLYFAQLLEIISIASESGDFIRISIFSNRNNAALYAISLLALYYVLSGRPIRRISIYLISGILFGTIGVFLAVIFSLIYAFANRRTFKFLAIPIFLGAIGFFFLPRFGTLGRLSNVFDSISYLMSVGFDLSEKSYGYLVNELGTTDLSFLFRIKHWTEILEIWKSGSIMQQLFGFSAGASVLLTSMHLVPHNDYLRYLFECGLFAFVGFILLILFIIRGIGRGFVIIPFLVIAVYFFSDNLANNYIAMMIFYFSAGVAIDRSKKSIRISK
jgi:hypothetical protein